MASFVEGPQTSSTSSNGSTKPVVGAKLARCDAGDLSDEVSTSSAASLRRETHQKYPENIHKRVNAMRHLYMETREKEHDLQIAMFKAEAETHKKLRSVWKKRFDIITGKHEPTANEAKFALSDLNTGAAETAPHDGQLGVPKFWLVVLNYSAHTADMIHPQDVAALEFLRDIRVEYSENPTLGFSLVFDFFPNPFFANVILTRSYEYSTTVSPAQLYSSNNLMPSKTVGCKIEWKAGKDLTKRAMSQPGTSKQNEERADSFFDFFTPAIVDLSQIGQGLAKEDDLELLEKAEKAGIEYEIAMALRSRIVPRALLFYTGEADTEGVDDSDYSGDYSDTEDSEEERGFKKESESDAKAAEGSTK